MLGSSTVIVHIEIAMQEEIDAYQEIHAEELELIIWIS
jgi:hypothetical protein